MANTVFSQKITIDGIDREFVFQQSFFGNELMYYIEVNDDYDKLTFRMVWNDNKRQWKVAPQVLPAWVFENEFTFNNIIEQDLGERK